METIFIPLSLAAGALLAVQAGANAQLSRATGSPFAATTLQLGVGALVLAGLAQLTGTLIALTLLPQAPWWHVLGGSASAFYVLSTILLFPRLGAVVSVGLFIAGQMLASLVLDTFGLVGVAEHPLGLGPASGTAVVLAGATLIVSGQSGGAKALARGDIGWVALALLAGAVLPVQAAVNALLRHDLQGASFAVGTISFLVATGAMATVLVASMSVPSLPRPNFAGIPSMPWWGWLGGFAGATYVTTVFSALPALGAASAIGLTVAGQQIAAVFVDRFGWFRLPKRSVSTTRMVGVMLLLAGVVAIKAL